MSVFIEALDDIIKININPSLMNDGGKRFTEWETLIIYLDSIGTTDDTPCLMQFYQYGFWKHINMVYKEFKVAYEAFPTIPVKDEYGRLTPENRGKCFR